MLGSVLSPRDSEIKGIVPAFKVLTNKTATVINSVTDQPHSGSRKEKVIVNAQGFFQE